MYVPEKFRHLYFDQSGRPLTQAERFAKFAEITPMQNPGDASTLAGTTAERQAIRREVDNTNLTVAKRVQEKASAGRGPRNHFRDMQHNLERAGASEKEIAFWRAPADRWDQERAAEAKAAEYNNRREVQLMRDHAQSLARSWKVLMPQAEESEIAYLLAIAASDAFESGVIVNCCGRWF
jgi:hypothetical protein